MAFLRFLVVTLVLAACSSGGEGKLTFSVRLPDEALRRSSVSSYRSAAVADSRPVDTIYIAAQQNGVVVTEARFPIASREADLVGLIAGEYDVVVEGRSGETALYRARKPGIVVEPAKLTEAGEFLLAPIDPLPPVLTAFPTAITNQASGEISGTKEMFTGIRLNGKTLVEPNEEKTFQFAYTLQSGANELAIDAINPEGTAGKAAHVATELDTVAPVAKSFVLTAVQAGLTFAAEAEGAVEMAIAEDAAVSTPKWVPYATSGTLSTLASTLYIQFRDRADNRSKILAAAVPSSLPPGNPSVAFLGSPLAVSTTTGTLVLSATNGPTQMQVSEDPAFTGATWVAYVTTLPFTLSATDGTKTVYARFRAANGATSLTASASVVLDSVPPSVTSFVVAGGPAAVSSPTVTLDITATEGVKMQLSESSTFSGATWVPFSVAPAFTLSALDGMKAIYLRVRDLAGNVSVSAMTTVDLDQAAPWSDITHPVIGGYYNALPGANGTATDNAALAGVEVALQRISDGLYWDGAAFSSSPVLWQTSTGIGTWSYALPGLTDGGYILSTRAVDTAGNVETPVNTVAFTFDSLPPTVPGTPVPAASPVSGPVNLSWSVASDNLAFSHYELERSSDLITYASVGTTATAAHGDAAADGIYYYRVRAFDMAGNVSVSPPSVAVTIDTTPPVISSLDVSSGSAGDSVWITGEGFGPTQGTSTVAVGSVGATVLAWSSSAIMIEVPVTIDAGNQPIVVTFIGMKSAGKSFTVAPKFTTAAVPAVGTGATAVSFAGTNFTPLDAIHISGVPMLNAAATLGTATADIPNDVTAGTQTIVLQAGGVLTAMPVTFTVMPQINSAATNAVVGGSGYSIIGTNLGATQGASALTAGGYALNATAWSHTSIFFDVPGSVPPGAYPLNVTVGGMTATFSSIAVRPKISLVTPSVFTGGDPITVTGAGFGALQGASTITVGGTAVTPSGWTDTAIAVNMPTTLAGGAVDFVVTVNGMASTAYGGTVKPNLVSVSNPTPPAGTSITLSGSNFGPTQGASSVALGALTAAVTSWSNTSISLTIPLAAATGVQNFVVTVGGQNSAALPVTVTGPAKLVFTGAPNTSTLAGTCASAPFAVQDGFSQTAPLPTTATVGFAVAAGNFVRFYDSSGCTSETTSVSLAAGSTSGTIYYVGVTAGTTTIELSAAGLTSAQQTEGTIAGPAVNLTFSAPATAAVNQCVSVTISSTDAYGNPANAIGNTTVTLGDSGAGLFNSSPLCTGPTTITSTLIAVGTSSSLVYFSDTVNELTSLSASATGYSSAEQAIIVGTPLPTITTITPTSGLPDALVTVNGLSFGAVRGAKDNVYFGGVSAVVSAWSATAIQAYAPPAAMPGAISIAVNAGGEWSNGVAFEHRRPWIDGRAPAEGTDGTVVTLTGRYLGPSGSATMGGSNATVQAWYPGKVTFTVPVGLPAGIVDIQATTNLGWASNRAHFTQHGNDVWLPFDNEVPQARARHTAVWTGAEMIIWSGRTGRSQVTGSRYNPGTDTWLATADAPIEGRYGHSAVWTGKEMIVWGGFAYSDVRTNTGARYNPATDSWSLTSTIGAPTAVERHAAVWLGDSMVITGGFDGAAYSKQSFAYDPETDTWQTLGAGALLPAGRADHRMVWTGRHLYVLGGSDGTYLADVYRWNFATQAWITQPSFTAGRSKFIAVFDGTDRIVIHAGEAAGPSYRSDLQYSTIGLDGTLGTWTTGATAVNARSEPVGVWTGTELLVFGGRNASALFQGGERWNKSTGLWSNMTTANQPSLRYAASGVWTGKEMIVWGGFCALNACMVNTGGRYNPQENTWTPTATVANALQAREGMSIIWTGAEAIIWGGSYSDGTVQYLNSGGRYNPASATWTPTSIVGAPTGRQTHSGVWTGTHMVIMVGSDAGTLNTSGRYLPASDSWATIPAGGGGPTAGPTARYYASAVWDPATARVLLWGGNTGPTAYTDTGKRYDPVGNVWSTMTASTGFVSARGEATAVMANGKMLVWGGFNNTYLNSGGTYDPGSDTWAVITTPALMGRKNHTAVWTGTDLIVWGGWDGTNSLSDGAVYNMAGDTWTSMGTSPLLGRRYHTAVWTGSEMLIWGGYGPSTSNGYADGAAYAYPGNTWRMMSTNRNTAFGRGGHGAFWSGTEMFVWGGGHGAHLFSGGRYKP